MDYDTSLKGSALERVHQFERIGLIKWCIVMQRHVMPAFDSCNGTVELIGSCRFARVTLQRYSETKVHVKYESFGTYKLSEPEQSTREIDYDFNVIGDFIGQHMKSMRGTLKVKIPGKDHYSIHYNHIGW